MKVREQPINHLKVEARVDENRGGADSRRDVTFAAGGGIFERTGRRRPYSDDPPPFTFRAGERHFRVRRDLVALGFDHVILHARGANWLEGAIADMERDFRPLDSAIVQRRQQLGREMQSGCRSGDRAAHARVDGLVPLAIGWRVLTLDIWREWNMPEGINQRVHVTAALRPDPYGATSVEMTRDDLRDQHASVPLESHQRTGFQLLSRMHERVGNADVFDRFG